MNLQWHELLTDDPEPDVPDSYEQILFHIYETEQTAIGFMGDDGVFISTGLGGFGPDDDYQSPPFYPDGLRIAWAYLDMDTVSFPKFEAIEQVLLEN